MIGEIAALAAALSFGISTVLARRFMVAVAPEAGVLVSIATNVLIFSTILAAAALGRLLPVIHPVSILMFAAGGIAGTLLGRNLAYQTIRRLGPALSTAIRLSNSIFTLGFGYLFLGELPRPWQVVGLAAVTVGLWVSLLPGRQSGRLRPRALDLMGIAMALAGAASFALGDTARRFGLILTPAPILGATVGAVTALLAHLLWSAFYRSARWPAGRDWLRGDLLGSALFNTVAILLLFTALRHAPVAIASVLYNLQALVVLIASPVLLRGQETITIWIVIGTLIALAGTALILLG